MATPPRVRTLLARGDTFKELLGYKRRSVYGLSYRADMWNSNALNPKPRRRRSSRRPNGNGFPSCTLVPFVIDDFLPEVRWS